MSIEWRYELILKCDIKDCQNKRRFYTRMGNPKSLESAATMYGWDFLSGVTICPKCGKKKYAKERIAENK